MFAYQPTRRLLPALLLAALLGPFAPAMSHGETQRIASPDGRLVVTCGLTDFEGLAQCPVYSVQWNRKQVIAPSRLELSLRDAPLKGPFVMLDHTTTTRDETWHPVNGERSTVRDHYNLITLRLQEAETPHRQLNLEFRAYDQGMALRYLIPVQEALEQINLSEEHTEFRLADDHTAWATYASQRPYEKTTVSRVRSGCERPLTLESTDGYCLALAEAKQRDYSRMLLGPLPGVASGLVTDIEGKVHSQTPFNTPWRVVMVGADPGDLLEGNDLILNLNDPCEIADTSWIKPGKVIRDVTLTTEGGKACVDFAVRHNLQYVIESAGWYGNEFTTEADATTVTLDSARSRGPLDLQEVIRYGEQKGIDVLVYVNRNQLEKQLDDIHPLYQAWGLKGIKYGFVRTGSQEWTNWLHNAIRDAANHKLLINVHDDYRPTGLSRTYPNLMTMEGICGDEESPPTEHTLTTLFTRMLAGAGDNTVCYFAPRVTKMGTHGAQLAKPVCLFSPMQWLYWYDRPADAPLDSGGAGGHLPVIQEVPELEFFDAVPTVWDDTKVVHGKIGQYAAVARRNGDDWYLGVLNGTEPRSLSIPLDFLTPGKTYQASIYADDPDVPTVTHIRIDRTTVDRQTTLACSLQARGGQAVRITPVD